MHCVPDMPAIVQVIAAVRSTALTVSPTLIISTRKHTETYKLTNFLLSQIT